MTTNTYLVALVDGGGTVPPELGAVRRLVERGHAVTVLAEHSMEAEVRATGAEYRPWATAPNRASRRAEDDPYRDWECKNPLQLFERLAERQLVGPAAAYAADLDVAVAARRPDIVLCSFFAMGAMVAAEAARIPYRVFMPNIYLLPARGLPPMGLGLRPAKGVLGRARDRAVNAITGRLWNRKGLPGINELRAAYGLAPLADFFDQLRNADRQIVMTSAAFDFTGELLDNVSYVGPVLEDPSWAEPWAPPPGDEPLVLVALSSTFQDQGECLQRIVDAVSTLPVRAVVTTGPAIDPATIRCAANVSVVRSAPHNEVLRHAAVVVNHGGHGTVMKALTAGVPMLVLPHGRDQGDNAVRVTTRGAGLTLKRGAKPAAIANAVRRLIEEPSFRRDAERLGEAISIDAQGGLLLRALLVDGARDAHRVTIASPGTTQP